MFCYDYLIQTLHIHKILLIFILLHIFHNYLKWGCIYFIFLHVSLDLNNLFSSSYLQYLVEAMNGEVEILIDEPIIFERNGQILEPEEELELPCIQASSTLSPAMEGFETNLENFAEEVTFLEANKQSNLGQYSSKKKIACKIEILNVFISTPFYF